MEIENRVMTACGRKLKAGNRIIAVEGRRGGGNGSRRKERRKVTGSGKQKRMDVGGEKGLPASCREKWK